MKTYFGLTLTLITITSLTLFISCQKEDDLQMVVNPIYPEHLNPLQGTWGYDTCIIKLSDVNVELIGFDTIGGDRVFSGDIWFLDEKGVLFHLDKSFFNDDEMYWGFGYEISEDTLWVNKGDYGRYTNMSFVKI